MSKQESHDAYARMIELGKLGGSLDSTYGWGKYFYIGERVARTYIENDIKEARVIQLIHNGLIIELKMLIGQPPDDANLEFANTIMDAAEHILMKGTVRK